MGEYYDSLASRLDAEGHGDDGEENLIFLRDDGNIEMILGDRGELRRVVSPDDSFYDFSLDEEGEESSESSEDEEEAQSEEEYTE